MKLILGDAVQAVVDVEVNFRGGDCGDFEELGIVEVFYQAVAIEVFYFDFSVFTVPGEDAGLEVGD